MKAEVRCLEPGCYLRMPAVYTGPRAHVLANFVAHAHNHVKGHRTIIEPPVPPPVPSSLLTGEAGRG